MPKEDKEDRGFIAWVCTKYAKNHHLSYYSPSRQSIICVYDQYKIYLKNYSKSKFDFFGDSEARQNFETFMNENDLRWYIHKHQSTLKALYRTDKHKVYSTKKDKGSLLYARDGVHLIKTTIKV